MKNLFYALSLIILAPALKAAGTLPTVPSDCFDRDNYCYGSDVTENDQGRRVIRVQLFARVDANEYSSPEALIGKFFDFASWPTYVQGSRDVSFVESRELEPAERDGQKIRRHLAHYYTGAPFPFRKIEVYEVANYTQLPTFEGALISYQFLADTSDPNLKGLKHKLGILHLALDQESNEYVLYLTIDVIPSIDLLPKIAAPYIEKAMMAIFLGMFDLR